MVIEIFWGGLSGGDLVGIGLGFGGKRAGQCPGVIEIYFQVDRDELFDFFQRCDCFVVPLFHPRLDTLVPPIIPELTPDEVCVLNILTIDQPFQLAAKPFQQPLMRSPKARKQILSSPLQSIIHQTQTLIHRYNCHPLGMPVTLSKIRLKIRLEFPIIITKILIQLCNILLSFQAATHTARPSQHAANHYNISF